MRMTIGRISLVMGLAVAALTTSIVPAAAVAAPPVITSITFSGTAGLFQPSPVLTIKGTGFGGAPVGTVANACNADYVDNGNTYANKLYFAANTKFSAGYKDASGATCIGITIVSWAPRQVVISFGNDTYGKFANYFLNNGDGYAISVKQRIFGGTVSGLAPARR